MTDPAMSQAVAAAALRYAQWSEAVASVSLSHPANCPCMTCRAAGGDVEAMAELVEVLERS